LIGLCNRREKGERRREKGERRREKGERRRGKGERRREKGEGRREKGEGSISLLFPLCSLLSLLHSALCSPFSTL